MVLWPVTYILWNESRPANYRTRTWRNGIQSYDVFSCAVVASGQSIYRLINVRRRPQRIYNHSKCQRGPHTDRAGTTNTGRLGQYFISLVQDLLDEYRLLKIIIPIRSPLLRKNTINAHLPLLALTCTQRKASSRLVYKKLQGFNSFSIWLPAAADDFTRKD